MRLDFLDEVLGTAGARALRKAIERQPTLEPLLVPRAVLAWVAMAARLGYEGPVPAHDVSVRLAKSEHGFSGSVGDVEFANETLYRVAARVAVAMGVDGQLPDARSLDLERLGKSLDALVKARVVAELRKAVLDPKSAHDAGYRFDVSHRGDHTTTVRASFWQGHSLLPVGEVDFHHTPVGTMTASSAQVAQAHTRKGIASHMYRLAEQATGKKIEPSKGQTTAGKALWEGSGPASAAPQFGKAQVEYRDQTFSDDTGEYNVGKIIDYARQHTTPEDLDVSELAATHFHPSQQGNTDEPPGSPEFVARANRADASHPIVVFQYPDGKWVADGAHRLWQAHARGMKTIKGFLLHHSHLRNVEMQKIEMPGQTAKPTEQGGAIAPQAPSRQQKAPAAPRAPKPAVLKLSEADLCRPCATCGGKSAIVGSRLRSCMCYRELGDVVLKKTAAGDFEVAFGSRWDDDARVLFLSERARI